MGSDVQLLAFWYSMQLTDHGSPIGWTKLIKWKSDSISLYTLELATQAELQIL